MSTKSSRESERDESTGLGFHLYDEAFDDDNVYLKLMGFQFEASSSVELSDRVLPQITIRFPIEWAQRLGLIAKPAVKRVADAEPPA